MKFLIISHALHKAKDGAIFSYAPYVREMNIWLKYVSKVEIIAPLVSDNISEIDISYQHKHIILTQIPSIEFTSVTKRLSSLFKLPIIFFRIFKACQKADHIHLRCPGNIGLLGCLVQIWFPKKPKTAKYAGNWDPKAKQPLSYQFQKWILSNTFLTKNMQVLVYGDWPYQSNNIKPFLTASFSKSEKTPWVERNYKDTLRFLFIGSLVTGKRPDLAIKIVEALHQQGRKVSLDVYGDGDLQSSLQSYIEDYNLSFVKLHGNTSLDVVKKNLQTAHFLILPSKSEGWPKAVAEAMFFGVIPIVTSISCIPYMIDGGNRGILIAPELERDILTINEALNSKDLKTMSKLASEWSQQFTLDYFELEIKKLLNTK